MKWAGTTSCPALQRGSRSPSFLLHVKIKRTKFFLLEEIGVQQPGRLVVIFTFQRIFSPQVVHFCLYSYSNCHLLGSLTLFAISELWGLIEGLEDKPLLQVETTLVNASTCQDLLSPTNLVGSCLVDVAAGMDNKILSTMTRKRGRAPSSFSNAPPPSKKTNVGPPKTSAPALPPPPPRKNGGEKVSDKSPEVSIHLGD